VKVVLVPFTYHPDAVGGTEVYVEVLASDLAARGVDVVVAAPGAPGAYRHRGVPVRRFAVSAAPPDLADLYGEGDPVAAAAFAAVVEAERPDVVHLHALTAAVSLRLLRAVRARGIPVAFTYHTPTVSCVRGTLLRWGREVCDGRLRRAACAACLLEAHGASRPLARALAAVPAPVGRALGAAGLAGGAWTALRMAHLVGERHRALRILLAEADRVVALCRWTRDLLVRNGVPGSRIVVSPHGLPPGARRPGPAGAGRPARAPGPVRLAYLGRLDPTKGVDLAVRAVRALPEAPVRLDVYGVEQDPGGRRYRAALARLAEGDGRIAFLAPVAHADVVGLLQGYDALVVPSRWLETGPLVVLEAFAAGTPVVGAALGGVAELVRHGEDGLLVDGDDPGAWRAALARLVDDPALLGRLRAGVRPPRDAAEVGADMLALYRELTGPGPAPRAPVEAGRAGG
jgi:glycosyltransferase involved in cell wall biosynthesis